MDSIVDPTFLLSLGGGTLAGAAVGVALRSAFKFALLLTGLLILLLAGLVPLGVITVDWGAIGHGIEGGAQAAGGMVKLAGGDLSAQLAGFSVGVVMGFKFR